MRTRGRQGEEGSTQSVASLLPGAAENLSPLRCPLLPPGIRWAAPHCTAARTPFHWQKIGKITAPCRIENYLKGSAAARGQPGSAVAM